MLKGVSEEQGLDGWVQFKITKVPTTWVLFITSMDYEQKFEEVSEDMNAIAFKQGKKKHGDEYMDKARDPAQKKGRKLTADERDKLRDKHSDNLKESIEEGRMVQIQQVSIVKTVDAQRTTVNLTVIVNMIP